MSFMLQFFDAPSVNSVKSAAEYAEQDQPAPAGANAKFARFVESVTEYFPDLSEDEDSQINLWPEGLSADATDLTDCPVANIAINLDMLDPGVMTVIAQHAAQAGLHILDPQNALLYLADRSMIGIDGLKKGLPDVTGYAYSVMTENVKGIGLAATSLRLAEGLHASWVKHGFVCAGVASQSAAVLWRKHGELRQMLDIRCMRSTSPGAIRLYVRLGFADERIAATWLPLLPKKYVLRKARFDANSGGVAADIALYLPSLRAGTLPDDATFSTNSDMLIRSLDELDAMLPMMRSWTERELLPMLDRIQSLDDLSGVALSDATLEYCEQGLPEFPVLPGLLVLAARRNAQTLARYAAAYRRNPRLLDLWRLYGDPQGAHFDALLAGLAKAA